MLPESVGGSPAPQQREGYLPKCRLATFSSSRQARAASSESIRLAGSQTDCPLTERVKTHVLPDLVSKRTADEPAGETTNGPPSGAAGFAPGRPCCAKAQPLRA